MSSLIPVDTIRIPSTELVSGRFICLTMLILLLLAASGCERPDPDVQKLTPTETQTLVTSNDVILPGRATMVLPPTPLIHRSRTPLPTYFGTPTPDPTQSGFAGNGENYHQHIVTFGETLSSIAQRYGSTIEELLALNSLSNGDFLSAGQTLIVPGGTNQVGPSFKLIPDSELVYGPGVKGYDVQRLPAEYGGFLLSYREEIEGQTLNGPEIVQLVADRYSVNPRLLLALLEYRSGWVTHPTTNDETYPMGYVDSGYEGLYQQLRWAANLVNLGYYGRSEGGLLIIEVGETQVRFAGDINDATAGVQLVLAAHPETSYERWLEEVSPAGFFAVYNQLHGNPFAYTVDPLWPPDLTQPALRLPWPEGETWYFTGGPHGGWASGSAWAALDFAPERQEVTCQPSGAWVTAMASGVVTRSSFGAVVVDMDGDGYAGTGWAITYMHLDTRDRIPVGAQVQVDDRLGHPSCEGGFVNATHTHVARTYNGRWVSADGEIPFLMSGWESRGLGREYDGMLIRGDVVIEACDCAEPWNAITRE